MVLVILVAGNDLRGLVETMSGYVEPKAIKQPDEDPPLLMNRFDLEVGMDLSLIEFSGLFKKGRVAPWKNGFSLDSKFKRKPINRGQTFRKKLCALGARNTIKL